MTAAAKSDQSFDRLVKSSRPFDRRSFLVHSSAASLAIGTALGTDHLRSFADDLNATATTPAVRRRPTAGMTEGPFYPDKLPLDTDNDLIVINDSSSSAVGEITYLGGRIVDLDGRPVPSAHVEIWQCDAGGVYYHSRDRNIDRRDVQFQSYGRFVTDRQGRYFFRTIKPVAYTGRTPHIHFAVSRKGRRLLTTQMLIEGEPQNKTDGLFKRIKSEQRHTVLAQFHPLRDPSPASDKVLDPAQWNVNFDIVLGKTAEGI